MGKGRPVGQSDILTKEELEKIVSLPDLRRKQCLRDYAVLLVLCNTPMRKGEIISLNRENLVNEGEKKYITYMALKKKEERYWLKLKISDRVFDGLKRYLEIDREGPLTAPLFRTLGKHGPHEATRITAKAIDLIIRKYIAQAGINKRITAHSFRATYTTIRKHRDPWTLKSLGGWASLDSVMPYVREDAKMMEEAAAEFSFS